jgi:hypothetical protein
MAIKMMLQCRNKVKILSIISEIINFEHTFFREERVSINHGDIVKILGLFI